MFSFWNQMLWALKLWDYRLTLQAGFVSPSEDQSLQNEFVYEYHWNLKAPTHRVHELFFWSLYLTNLQLPLFYDLSKHISSMSFGKESHSLQVFGFKPFSAGLSFSDPEDMSMKSDFPSILPLFTTYLNDSGNLQQQSKQRSLDFPHPGHLFLPICLNGGPSGRGGQSQLAPFQVEDQQI